LQSLPEIPVKQPRPLDDPAVTLYAAQFIEGVVRRFAGDILTSIVLPHKIYKRVMNRVLRKTTYSAIQQAVDIAYRLEEDTISLADKLLDSFVEQ